MCTENAIIPSMFMPDSGAQYLHTQVRFYNLPENMLHHMAESHWNGEEDPATGFSSWAASLHSVLCYARSLEKSGKTSIHVAVMDRSQLDDEVLVWHVPHFIPHGNLEYLAFGIIRGNGYKAVSLRTLDLHGLLSFLPEFKDRPTSDSSMFNHELRSDMFLEPPKSICIQTLDVIKSIGLLFGSLYFPMATAMACLRPRLWKDWRRSNGSRPEMNDLTPNIFVLYKYLAKNNNAIRKLVREPWLEVGRVQTKNFPDVELWFDLIKMLAESAAAEHQKSEDENKKHARDDDDGQEPPAKRVERELQPHGEASYKLCADFDCGECVGCENKERLQKDGFA
jgi:hypothetical protein